MSKPLNWTKAKKRSRRRSESGARLPIGLVVRSALADDALRMLSHEPGARRSSPEDVHQMRTASRRFRSDLRYFGPALREDHSRGLRDELRWLAGILGSVRDLDVLEQRLRGAAVELEVVSPSDPLFEEIARRLGSGRSALAEALDGDRYAALRGAAIAEARAPELAGDGDGAAVDLLGDRLARDWHRLLDRLRETPPDAPIAALHEFRKRAKRTRYAAEAASEWLGGRAGRRSRRIGKRARRVQETLGRLQDAVVAAAFIEEVMAALPAEGPSRSALDALRDLQRREAEAALDAYGALRDRFTWA